MTTQEFVKKEAKIYWAISETKDPEENFADGLSAGIELAMAFAEWVDGKFFMAKNGWTDVYEVPNPSEHTTSELFEIFLTERNEK